MPCLLLLNQIPDYHSRQGQNNQTDYNINSVQSISSFPVLSEKPDYNPDGNHHQDADSGQYNYVYAVQCHLSFFNYNLVLLQRKLCFLVRIRTEQQVQHEGQHGDCEYRCDAEGHLAQNQSANLVHD